MFKEKEMKRALEDAMQGVLRKRPTATHVNLMVNNLTPLLVFLQRNIVNGRLNKEAVKAVREFVDRGASLTLANDRGVSPFHLLVMSLALEDDVDIQTELLRILSKAKGRLVYPTTGRTPLYVLMNRFYAGRALDGTTAAHPIRRLVRNIIKDLTTEQSSKLRIRCIEAIRSDAAAFVKDVLESAHLDPDDLDKILTEAIIRDRIDLVSLLLDHGAPVSETNVLLAAYYLHSKITEMLLKHIRDKDALDRIFSGLIRSTRNERPDNAAVNQCRRLFLDKNAVASPEVMRMLVAENNLHLVRLLHGHGSRLALPSQIPAKRRAYDWVQREIQRKLLIGAMSEHDMGTKKPRKNQKLWKSVGRQTSTMPKQLVKELHQYL